MSDSRKRPAIPTQSNKVKRTAPVAKPRPSIVGTKASEARAKAIKSAQMSGSRSHAPKRKRPPTEEPNTLVKSYHTTASGLKQRPAWDLRGKVADMTNLYELNIKRLDDLRKFKRELEVLKDEKESQEKEALQKAANLRAELLTLERDHQADIADLHANQRIEYQRLEDENLNYTRKLNTIDIEVNDAKNRLNAAKRQLEQIQEENRALTDTIEKTSMAYEEADAQIRQLKVKVEKVGKSITEREQEVRQKQNEIEDVTSFNNQLQAQLTQSQSKRARLLTIIKDLQVNAAGNKRVVTKNQA